MTEKELQQIIQDHSPCDECPDDDMCCAICDADWPCLVFKLACQYMEIKP